MILYDKILNILPSFTKSFYKKAQIYKEKKSKKENDMYNQILFYEPNNEKILEKKIIWCYFNQQYSDALKSTEKISKLNPTGSSYSIQGKLLELLGRFEDALLNYDKAIQLNPKNDSAYNNKGFLLQKFGRLEEALLNYDKAIKLNPYFDSAYIKKGFLLEKFGRFVEARDTFNKVKQLNQDNHFVCNKYLQ